MCHLAAGRNTGYRYSIFVDVDRNFCVDCKHRCAYQDAAQYQSVHGVCLPGNCLIPFRVSARALAQFQVICLVAGARVGHGKLLGTQLGTFVQDVEDWKTHGDAISPVSA